MPISNGNIDSSSPVPPTILAMPDNIATTGLKWLFAHRQSWGLSIKDVADLLGGLSPNTVKDWRRELERGAELSLPQDVVERLSLLLGIHKALVLLTPVDRQSLAWQWFQAPTDLYSLKGQSIKDYLLSSGSIESFYHVRQHLDNATV